MDRSLQELEERLQQLVPRGLGDRAREQCEEKIEVLAAEGVPEESGRSPWRWVTGAVAGVLMMAGLVGSSLVRTPEAPGRAGNAGSAVMDTPGFATLELVQSVEDRFDGGYVLGGGDHAPHRYWGYAVTETEVLQDSLTGLTVRISTEREEGVLTELTTF